MSLGNLWVNRLVTRTRENYVEVALRDPTLAALSTIGRCSSVTGPTPNRPWQLRLLSMNKCRSSAGTDDWAFRANQIELWEDDHASRVISVRIGATGSPVHAGDMASIVVDSSAGTGGPTRLATGRRARTRPAPTWARRSSCRAGR